MTNYAAADWFTDPTLIADPFPFYEYLRAQGPVVREPQRGVVVVTGYDEALAVYRDAEHFSSINAPSGPIPPLPFTPDPHDIGPQIEQYRAYEPPICCAACRSSIWRSGPARYALILAVLLAGAGCASPTSSDWLLESAQKRRDDGKLDAALRFTEQALQRQYADPEPALVDLHVGILQEMGRTAESEAFLEFVGRYRAGADTEAGDPNLSFNDCRSSQPGLNLIRDWGDPPSVHVPYSLNSLVATFEIDSEGNIGKIKVVQAQHPGAARLIIQSIGTARLSPATLAHRRETDPASFPVSLCAWWTFARDLPADIDSFRVRGPGMHP